MSYNSHLYIGSKKKNKKNYTNELTYKTERDSQT